MIVTSPLDIPPADDSLGRVHAVRDAVTRAVGQVDPDDFTRMVRGLATIADAVRAEADELQRTIPSDQHGNPLPEGEAHRLMWSALNSQADDLNLVAMMALSRTADVVRRPAGL